MKESTLAQRPAKDPQFIKTLFASISENYDRANDVMTFGLARRWRRKLVQWSGAHPQAAVLDCATGTGDLAIEFKRCLGPSSRVVGTDFCEEMLNLAPKKASEKNLEISFSVADATALPFPDSTFDVTSIAYGIRNVSDPLRALHEMARVTRSGGVVMILETGNGQFPLLRPFIKFYFQKAVPRLGAMITGHKSAYEYLNQSSNSFPARQDFVDLMNKTERFSQIAFRSFFGGASFLYRGVVS